MAAGQPVGESPQTTRVLEAVGQRDAGGVGDGWARRGSAESAGHGAAVAAPSDDPAEETMKQGWRAAAACRDIPSDVLLSTDPSPRRTRAAASVCAGCLVIDECLAYAITHDVPYGIWGGLTGLERSRIRRAWLDGLAS